MFNDILKNNNLTVKEVSDRTGVPKSTLADLAKGRTDVEKMSVGNLYRLSHYFGVTMDDMMFYCKLSEQKEYSVFIEVEQGKLNELGLKPYCRILKRARLIQTCKKLNDMQRFMYYRDVMAKFYATRGQQLPEEYL